MARVFISHSSRDVEPAARIKAWLQEQGFETPFLDFDKHAGIPPGADWEKTLYREIEQSEAIIIIQTPNWMDSKWCFTEYTQARALGKAIFPVIEAPTGETLIARDIQALNLLKDREGGLERLSKELTRLALDAQGGFPWDSNRPPFPGLSAFQEEDAALYFGRDDDIRRLIERLNARRAQGGAKLIALLGASGSGKSSLLRAGVIPRLKRDRRNWIVLPPIRPQTHPVDELARAIAVALKQGSEWRSRRDQLNGADLARTLSDLASDLRMQVDANEAQVLISVDQAEELFGASDPTEADRFFEILNVATSENLPFLTVLAQRSDFLEKLQSVEKLTARFEEFSLGPLPLTRIPQIIEGPARVAGLSIDDGLVLQASRHAETEDALPLLAFALRELFDRYASDNRLTLENYHALGDTKEELTPLENAVRKAADDVLADARPGADELTALRDAFVPAMVRVNDKGEYVRRPAQWDDLPAKAHPLLESLAKARLLVISQAGDDRIIEVAHEALLRKWPRLREWLDDAREFLTGKQQMDRDLHDWERAAETDKPGALLTGLKLNRARSWLLERPHQLTTQERAFVRASIDKAEADEQSKLRIRRRITQLSIASALLLACIALFAGWQWRNAVLAQKVAEDQTQIAENQRKIGLSRQLAAQAISFSDRQLDLALLLSLEANKITDEVDAKGSLLKALTSNLNLGRILRGHTQRVDSVAISPNNKIIASGSFDGKIILWDIATGQQFGKSLIGHTREVSGVAFSPDSKMLVSGSYDGTVRLWTVTTQMPFGNPLSGHTGKVHSVAFSPDGQTLASSGQDHTVILWDVGTREQRKPPLKGHEALVGTVGFSPDGRMLASGDDKGIIILWDLVEHQPLGRRLAGHKNWVLSLDFSPDGQTLASGGGDNRIILWDVNSLQPRDELRRPNWVHSLSYSPDGKSLASGGQDGSIVLLDVGSRKTADVSLTSHTDAVMSVSFSPDGKTLVSGSVDKTVILWEISAQQRLGDIFAGLSTLVQSLAFSPDGRNLASAGDDNTITLWDISAPEPLIRQFRGHTEGVRSIAFSPDSRILASGSNDTKVILWDVSTGNQVGQPLIGHRDRVLSLAFSPDSKTLASGSKDRSVILWDVNSQKQIDKLQGHDGFILSVDFSPNGKWLATGSWDRTARLWNVATGENEKIDAKFNLVHAVAISPNSQTLAIGGYPRSLTIMDIPTRRTFDLLSGHSDEIFTVAFSPDGKTLASGSKDRSVILWNVATRTPLGPPLTGHTNRINSVVFSPDGKSLASSDHDGNIFLWDVSFDSWKARACSIANRSLTKKEWRQYVGEDEHYDETCPNLPRKVK